MKVVVLSSDRTGTSCNLADRTGGICAYYVVHMEAIGATAVSFSAPVPSCFSGTWLSDTPTYPVTLGNSQSGVSVGYGSCLSSPIHVLTISFFCQGTTGDCCEYRVLPRPDALSGQVEVVDCSETLMYGSGGRAVINGNPGCPCGESSEDSTWGRVKTLYTE
jgi:hypothetical protein